MFKMTFGTSAQNCNHRARKLAMSRRRQQVRRPIEAALDQQFSAFDDNELEDAVQVTAKSGSPYGLIRN